LRGFFGLIPDTTQSHDSQNSRESRLCQVFTVYLLRGLSFRSLIPVKRKIHRYLQVQRPTLGFLGPISLVILKMFNLDFGQNTKKIDLIEISSFNTL
jgi:hypothetical protein